jgi:hypothetical protein
LIEEFMPWPMKRSPVMSPYRPAVYRIHEPPTVRLREFREEVLVIAFRAAI